MRVFITWSGPLSHRLAEALRQWLPGVIQAVKPYFSPDDVTKGARWNTEIAKELEVSRVGLLCLTPDNLEAPWVMFEAGALSKNLDRSKVCPLLFGLEPADVKGPLVQFQASKFSQEEMKRVVRMINAELGDQALAADVLDGVFGMWWPKLEKEVAEIATGHKGAHAPTRTEKDMISEVLELTRSLARHSSERVHPDALRDLSHRYRHLQEICATAPAEVKEVIEQLEGPIDYILRTLATRRTFESDELRHARPIRRLQGTRRPEPTPPAEVEGT